MSEQVVPVTGLNTVGLVKDTPAIALPPNAFSDVMNVRFSNGCVSKMSGEKEIISSLTGDTNTFVGTYKHIAWWANPNLTPSDGYFLVVTQNNNLDRVYVIRASDGYVRDLQISVPSGGTWQHTVYQGGYAIVLNNGIARPMYILDADGNLDITTLDMFELPGWDSYYANEVAFNDVYDTAIHLPEFDLGRIVDFDAEQVIVSVYSSASELKFQVTLDSVTTVSQCTLSYDQSTDSHFVTIATAPGGDPAFTDFLENGDTVYISIRTLSTVQVRAGVIRTWGDTLVAGNLTTINAPLVESVDSGFGVITFTENHSLVAGDQISITQPWFAKGIYTVNNFVEGLADNQISVGALPSGLYDVVRYTIVDGSRAIRNQPGVVRISDVAGAGAIPHNWNPYTEGVSTAEEFTLATTGIVQDLVQMQGNLYVYTNNSIHLLTRTGNSAIPYVADIASSTHGALCMDSVIEFRGKHIVVGSDDIYEFSGHPASIKSLAYERVRDYLYDNINADYSDNLFLMLNSAQDEIWINFPTYNSGFGAIDEQLIFNYNGGTWTRRAMTPIITGVMANTKYIEDSGALSNNVDPSVYRPVFVTSGDIIGVDFNNKFTDMNDNPYESYIERKEAPMTPEFDVESLHSVALWVGKAVDEDVNLKLRFRPTDYPSQTVNNDLSVDTTDAVNVTFTIGDDYKADVRTAGRFINYRITDDSVGTNNWFLSGMQLDIKKGGRR